MNHILSNTINKYCPKINDVITNGVADKILKLAPLYLNNIFESSIKSLSSSIQLKYKGYERMTPDEEFTNLIISNNNKVTYDIATSDLYVIKYIFEYMGEEIIKPIYLPYCTKGNILRISNTKYHILPILSDRVISPSYNEVFVRLLKAKLTFKYITRNFIINGEKKPENVIYVEIVNTNSIGLKDCLGKQVPAVTLYLLGKYGLKQSLKKYMGIENVIITLDDVEHLRDKYHVFESTKEKPSRLKVIGYSGHNLKILVPNTYDITPCVKNFICGLIYSLDVLPEQADDYIDIYNSNELHNELLYWKQILGKIIYKNYFSITRITQDMKEHFDSLEGYLDNTIKEKLVENHVKLNDFFDLLFYILKNFNDFITTSKEYSSDINNRYIDILYYLMYDIIISYNKAIININKRASKKQDAGLSFKEINKLLGDFKTKTIFKLVKSSSPNLAIQSISESTLDIMYPKITAILEDQSRGNGVNRSSKSVFPEHTKTIKGHDIYLGSILFLNKDAPSPRFRSNLYMDYDIYTGKILIDKKTDYLLKNLDKKLRGKIENNKINIIE